MRGIHKPEVPKGVAEIGFWTGSASLAFAILSLIGFARLSLGQEPGSIPGSPALGAPSTTTAPIGAGNTGFGVNPGPVVLAPAPIPTFAGPAADGSNLGFGVGGVAFRLIPSLDVGETYNDNVNLASRGHERSDLITSISPGLDMTANTRRLQGRLVYNPQALIFARGTNADTIQQRLLGTGNAKLYRDMLFLDTSASIQQGFVSATGPIGPTTLTGNGNLQTVRTINASPYLREHLSSYADSETRYNFSSITTSGGQIAPERINEALQRFTSGDYFGRLRGTLTGDWTRIDRLTGTSDRLGGTSSTDKVARADFQYLIYHPLSVIGGIGYEQITDPTLISRLKGVIWNAGFQYQPNHLFSTSLTYGRRFQQTDIEFSALYALRPDLRVHASFTQAVQTGQSQIARNLNQITLGPNGTFIDPQTGLPINPNFANGGLGSSAFGITSGAFLDKIYEVDIEATRGRNSYVFTASDEKRTGQNTAFSGTSANERVMGASLSWTRQLWPDLSSNFYGGYSHATFLDGSGRIDNRYWASLNFVYTISSTASAVLSTTRYQTNSNFPGSSTIDDVITVSVHKQF